MNKDEFNHLIQTLDTQHASSETIEKAIAAFPYASTLHWFRSKALSDSKDLQANAAIRKAAVLSKDRSLFFDFILSETLSATVEKIETEIAETPSAPSEKQEVETPVSKQEVGTEEPRVIEKVVEKAADEPKITKPKETETETQPETEHKEEAENQVSTINKGQPEVVPEKAEVSKEEEEKLKKELEKQIVSVAISASISKDADEPLVEEEPKTEKEPEQPANDKKTFSSWLKDLKEGESKKKHKFQKDLIDQFIQNDPQITPKKVSFFSPTQQAKLSLAEDETFVTETLAKIYAQQGNHQKAIKAYEMLMLKYPEKKAFFAGRIKEIKKQLK